MSKTPIRFSGTRGTVAKRPNYRSDPLSRRKYDKNLDDHFQAVQNDSVIVKLVDSSLDCLLRYAEE